VIRVLACGLCAAVSLALAGCAGEAFKGSEGGDGGTVPGSGGTTGSGGSVASGGTNASGGTGGIDYPDPTAECRDTSECVAVVDTSDPCFSADCSGPIAASLADMTNNPCLVLWEEREQPVEDACASSEPVTCPAVCAVQPACVDVSCSSNSCELELIENEANCPGTADCTQLNDERREALMNARECSTAVDGECVGDPGLLDVCGCEVAVNHNRVEQIALAKSTYDAWSSAGCPPDLDCSTGCQSTAFGASCGTLGSMCIWN
jgi:hypothetical protein